MPIPPGKVRCSAGAKLEQLFWPNLVQLTVILVRRGVRPVPQMRRSQHRRSRATDRHRTVRLQASGQEHAKPIHIGRYMYSAGFNRKVGDRRAYQRWAIRCAAVKSIARSSSFSRWNTCPIRRRKRSFSEGSSRTTSVSVILHGKLGSTGMPCSSAHNCTTDTPSA